MTDYTKTGKPLQNARAISKQLRDEFALIEAAINSKANIASPTFTGTPAAPTASAGSSGTQLATLDFVNAAILGVSVTIPGQAGNSGKFLKTVSESASWQWIHPTQIGNANKSLMSDGTGEEGQFWGNPTFVYRNSQAGAYTALAADRGKLIDWSGSSDNTLTFTACATIGDGWFCFIRNSGTADLTLDPNASETIDGLATFKMYPGEARIIQCDGSVLRSIVICPFYKVFTASDTFTKPPGYSYFGGIVLSGGGGGARNASTNTAYGGGGGGCMPINVKASSVSTTESITVGAGGTGRTGSTGSGVAGGDSSFGSFITVTGGAGGTTAAGGGGGLTSLLSRTAGVVDGFGASSNAATNGIYGGASGGLGAGANSVYGGGSGGGSSTGAGGSSSFAGAGGAGSSSSTGGAGTAPSGGGGGANNDNNGGDGARGEVRIWGLV